jgi:hypothetical protein
MFAVLPPHAVFVAQTQFPDSVVYRSLCGSTICWSEILTVRVSSTEPMPVAAAAAGYCGARGNFDDPDVVKAVSETLTTLFQFLHKQLK